LNIVRIARRSPRVTALVSALAAAALGLSASQAAATPASAASPVIAARAANAAAPAKPTIVLVHGAFADSSSWDGEVIRLQRDGYTVDVPPNPLLGLPYDSAYIRDFLNTISGPIILVGHSYGGAVITDAATGDANVKALVYVDAFLPAQGETIGELINAVPGTCVAAPNLVAVPYPDAPSGSVDDYISQSAFPWCFGDGLPAAEAAELGATQRPLPSIALTQPSGVPAWKSIPSWDVIGTIDNAIPPAEQLAMAERAHAKITMVHAGHLSMVADPGVVTNVILAAVKATT
jgi:pimeloyl-ACP methyl ester carboxylesterase